MEHDRTLLASHVKPHLKYIPTYLMPGATSLDTDGTAAAKKAAAPPRNLKRKRTSGKVRFVVVVVARSVGLTLNWSRLHRRSPELTR